MLVSRARDALARAAPTAAVFAGLAWPATIFLKDYDLLGLTYDEHNRLLTLPLLVFPVALAGAWGRLAPRLGRGASVGLGLGLAGFALMLAGNVLEFWGVLLQDRPNAYAAWASGEEPWFGSLVGWLVFGLGMLTLTLGAVVFGVASRRRAVAPATRFSLTAGLVGLASFLHPLTALAFGAAWVAVGVSLARDAPRARSPELA